jgi:hypothetical protein
MIERLLRTVAHNSERNYRGKDLLLEVLAQVPRLPARDVAQFRKFSKAQGLLFAKAVDDWLESRNIRKLGARQLPTREAGIVAFAFNRPTLPRI